MKLGYARVSTVEQNLNLQKDACGGHLTKWYSLQRLLLTSST